MKTISNKLLQDAIADADALVETAVANAKLSLEESMQSQIRDMVARRLRVEADHEKAKELPHQEGEPEGSTEMPADSSTIGAGDNKEPSDDAFDSAEDGSGPESEHDSSTDWYDDWSESDFDLDEVIKELENDIASLSGKEDDEEEAGAPKAMVPPQQHKEVDETEMAMDPHKYQDPSLKMDGVDGGEEDVMGDEEEIDLEEILAELEAEDNELHGDDDREKEEMATEIAGLKSELAEYKQAFNLVSGRLQEVNLLNAKLLFTNKMFRKANLTNEQKVRVVESLDRATNVREVKLVYAALTENLATAAKTFNTSRKKVVAEGLASKVTPSTAPKATTQPLVENAVAKRLQQLAGIIS